jgi:hypothetical protein
MAFSPVPQFFVRSLRVILFCLRNTEQRQEEGAAPVLNRAPRHEDVLGSGGTG